MQMQTLVMTLAVNERLKGGTPPKKAPEGENSLEKQIEAAMARGF